MTPEDVFVSIATPAIVAQEVADFMVSSRDQVSEEFIQAVYQKMYDYGVPMPQVLTFPPIGFPSVNG